MELSLRHLAGLLLVTAGALGCGQRRDSSPAAATGARATPPATAPTTTSAAPGRARTARVAPTIASLSTATGPVDGGAPVTITGSGFQAAGAGETFVLFGLRAVAVAPASDARIDLVAPAGATPGPVDVRVTNALGSAALRGAFAYTPRAASLAFEPSVGHHELGLAGTRITLTLRDFSPVSSTTAVAFGGVPAASVSVIDTGTLVAEVPDGLAPGTVAVTVEESGRKVSAAGFLVQGPLAYGDLIVNEVCPAPSGLDTNGDGARSSSADEFVEVVNVTARPIDLSYLTMYDSKTIERHRFPNPTMLPPGGAIVIFGAGTPQGFAERHRSGAAQQATSSSFSLDKTADTIEIRTLPGLAARGTTIFILVYTNPPAGSSLVNAKDGQPILSNPATSADYVPHTAAPGAKGPISPGRRVDGSPF